MQAAVGELLTKMLAENALSREGLISVLLTSTPDLKSEFPAAAARGIGLSGVPLLCAQEIDVVQAMPRVVRVLMHANLDLDLHEVKHIYLRGAASLRKDLTQ